MAKVLDSLTLPIKKNGVVSNETIVNNPLSTASQFSTSTAYSVGQYVYYDKKLYRFTTAHAAGAWNAGHVTEVTVASELADLKEDTTELKQDLKDNFGLVKIEPFIPKKYINTNVSIGSTVSLSETSSNGYTYALFECAPKDKILINAVGGNNPRLWAFMDSEYKLLAKSDAGVTGSNLVVTAPANTKYCIINSTTGGVGNCYITPDWKGATSSILSTKYNELSDPIPSGADLNDYTTPGNYYVSTTAIANSLINGATNAGGRLVVMTLTDSFSIFQAYISIYGKIYTRKRDANYWSYWEEVATDPEVLTYGTKSAYNALQALVQQSDYNMAFANAFVPLSLNNYLRNTQNVHPKVLYFSNGFGSHNYWMVYTPYPHSDDIYENPCIAYSDDGYAWKNISGNPLDTPEGNNYNSDGHLVYRSDTQTLEMWYRYYDRTTEEKTIYRKTSQDGVTWSEREEIKTFGSTDDCASPAIEWDGTNYQIWGVSSGITIDYYTAPGSDVTTWTKVRSFNITADDGGVTVRPWHLDVIKDDSTYVMLLMCRNSRNVSDGVWSLFITTSSDNITYTTPVKVIGGSDGWDKYMYRSSIVKVGSKYRIYYSAGNSKSTTSIYNNAYWGMGISESDTLTSGYIGRYE